MLTLVPHSGVSLAHRGTSRGRALLLLLLLLLALPHRRPAPPAPAPHARLAHKCLRTGRASCATCRRRARRRCEQASTRTVFTKQLVSGSRDHQTNEEKVTIFNQPECECQWRMTTWHALSSLTWLSARTGRRAHVHTMRPGAGGAVLYTWAWEEMRHAHTTSTGSL